MLTTYLAAEQPLGRVAVDGDLSTVSLTLVGAVHLLFTVRESGPPGMDAVRKVVVSAMHGLVWAPIESDAFTTDAPVSRCLPWAE